MNGAAHHLRVNRVLAVLGLGMLCAVLAVHLGLCLVAPHGHGSESMASAHADASATVVDVPDQHGGEHPHDGAADCCDQVAVRGAGPAALLGALLVLLAVAFFSAFEDACVFLRLISVSPPTRLPGRLPAASCLSTLYCVYRT